MRNLIIITAMFVLGCNEDKLNTVSQIHYVPIGAETYVPVTPSNIESSAVQHGAIEGRYVADLLVIVRKRAVPGKFDRNIVRAKIRLPDGLLLYIDNEGGLLLDGKELTWDKSSLSRAKKIIEGHIVSHTH